MSRTLTNIPKIMRSHGWLNGARLLEIWFSRPSAIAPMYAPPDTSTIRMNTWALTFTQLRQTYNQIMSEKIWMHPNAQKVIVSILRRKGLSGSIPRTWSFGNQGSQEVVKLDADHINHRSVSSSDLNDVTAALGDFSFYVLVAGSVTPILAGSQFLIEVKDVGIYIKDSFDFNDNSRFFSQFLGYWDDSDNSVKKVEWWSYEKSITNKVTNRDFRNWRSTSGRGGDFLVFSDIKWTHLAPPDTFVISLSA